MNKEFKYYYTIMDYGGICECCLKEKDMTVERIIEIHPWAKEIALVVK
jgi:hypothetical protein